jgi:hypothetical protein
MKYDLSDSKQAADATLYLIELTKLGKKCEIKPISPRRSLNQNAYLHLLLGAFGAHFGYTLDEAKLIYKRDLNPDIYVYNKELRGKTKQFIRSSADLTVEEMTKSIDRLREWSAKGGYDLPLATDQEWLMQLDNEIERAKKYL